MFSFLDIRINYSDLEFGEKIGGGSFGTVFKGHWKSKGLDVAIKRFSRIIEREEVSLNIYVRNYKVESVLTKHTQSKQLEGKVRIFFVCYRFITSCFAATVLMVNLVTAKIC